MKTHLIFLSILIFLLHTQGQSQSQSEFLKTNPTNEFGLYYSHGILSPNNYSANSGGNFFVPQKFQSNQFGFHYSRFITPKLKLSTGVSINLINYGIKVKFDTNNLNSVGNIFSSSTYESTLKEPFGTAFLGTEIPLMAEYQLAKFGQKHELWANIGLNFLMSQRNCSSIDYISNTQGNNYIIASARTHIYDKMYTGLNFGINYNYNITPTQQISFGIKVKYNLQNMINGTYQFMPDDPSNAGSGTFSNKLNYLGFSVGYNFNNGKHLIKKRKRNNYQAFRGDTLPDKHEFIISTPYFGSTAFQFGNPSIIASGIMPGGLSRIDFNYKTYLNPKFSWTTGIGIGYNRVFFSSENQNIGRLEDLFLNASFGINYKKQLSERWAFEVGIDVYGFANLYNPSGTFTHTSINMQDSNSIISTSEFSNFHRFGMGIHPHFGFSYTLNNLDKLFFTVDYYYDLTSTTDLNFTINPSTAPQTGFFKYNRSSLLFTIGYGFTGKLRRLKRQTEKYKEPD